MPTVNEAVEQLTKTVGEVRSFIETHIKDGHEPLKADFDRMRERILEDQRALKRAQVAENVTDRGNVPAVRSGPYAGMDAFDLAVAAVGMRIADTPRNVGRAKVPAWRSNLMEARKDLFELAGRALDADEDGLGAELTYEGLSSTVWRDLHLATMVAGLFDRIMMPTTPFRIPFEFGDLTWYRGSANVAGRTTNASTNRATLEAETVKAIINWSYELDEESVIAVLPELRATLVRNGAEVWDDLVLNGDQSDDGSNINADGAGAGTLADQGGYDHLLSFNGLLHRPLVDNSSQALNHNGAADADMYNDLRAKLGRFGTQPSGMAFICDIWTYLRSQTNENFRTLDKLGPRATILTGQLGDVEGVPLIVSEQMKLADTDGKVSRAGNGTDTGRLLAVARSQYRTGSVRELLVETDRDIVQTQTVMVASFRMAFTGRALPSEDAASALQYNITGVA